MYPCTVKVGPSDESNCVFCVIPPFCVMFTNEEEFEEVEEVSGPFHRVTGPMVIVEGTDSYELHSIDSWECDS